MAIPIALIFFSLQSCYVWPHYRVYVPECPFCLLSLQMLCFMIAVFYYKPCNSRICKYFYCIFVKQHITAEHFMTVFQFQMNEANTLSLSPWELQIFGCQMYFLL